WNVPEAADALEQQLNDAGVGFAKLNTLLVTHIHPDHYGLAGMVKKRSGAKVIIHQRERDLIRSRYRNPEQLLATMGDWLLMQGVPADQMQDLKVSAMPVRSYVEAVEPDEVVWGGERLPIGRFEFEVWWTPGHSPRHICFLERAQKFILTGDHVLPTITPNVSLHPQQQGNPLGDYIASLERLEGLDVKTVLPAHEYTFEDLHGRLRGIEQHHEERLGEMMGVIGDQPRTAYEVAKGVKWATGSFDTFSSWMQRAARSVRPGAGRIAGARADGATARLRRREARCLRRAAGAVVADALPARGDARNAARAPRAGGVVSRYCCTRRAAERVSRGGEY